MAKLLLEEDESPALRVHLAAEERAGRRAAACWLSEAEIMRVAQRFDRPLSAAMEILNRFDIAGITRDVYQRAGLLIGRDLRALDAMHIAVALTIGADQFISYDRRQSESAVAAGLSVLAPD